jgi:hypothetical protein
MISLRLGHVIKMDVAVTHNRLMFVELSRKWFGGDGINFVAVDEYLVQMRWGTKDDLYVT